MIIIIFKYFIYLFLKTGEGREKEREDKNTSVREEEWLVASCLHSDQGQHRNPGTHADLELNQWPFAL